MHAIQAQPFHYIVLVFALIAFIVAAYNYTTDSLRCIAIGLALIVLSMFITGCATQRQEVKGWWNKDGRTETLQTAQLVFAKAVDISIHAVLDAAVSATDRNDKGNYLESLGTAFRSQEGNLLTANDVRSLVAIWTPDKTHWRDAGTQFADLYAKAQPKTPHDAALLLEEMAKAVQTAPTVATNP